MNRRLLFLGTALAAVVALAVLIAPRENGTGTPSPTPLTPAATTPPTATPPTTGTPTTTPIVAQFSATGNLTINNSGQKPSVWYLNYTQSGRAVSQELQFTPQSTCTISGVTRTCASTALTPGMRVSVTGTITSGLVTVARVTGPQVVLPPASQKRTIWLYYYNEVSDRDASGNLRCSATAVMPVTRQINVTQTPIQDTIRLLIQGNLTAAEKTQGFKTEFPHAEFKLKGANLVNGVLTLEFNEVSGFTSGGSCRVTLLAEQIRKTALQFPEVKEVRFIPTSLFQP